MQKGPVTGRMYDEDLARRSQKLIEASKERAARAMQRGCPKCLVAPNRSCISPLGIPLTLQQGWVHDERHDQLDGGR